MKASVADIITATAGRLIAGDASTLLEGVCTDTRNIRAGGAFIALAGEHYDGHSFLADAVTAGAVCLVVSSRPEYIRQDIATVLVADTLVALGNIANWWRRHFSIPIVGITGSSGKTTTKEMLATICCTNCDIKKNIAKSEGNFNNLVGLPLSLLSIKEGDEMGIFEMGTNASGEIARLTTIAQPTIGLITNIGLAHIGGLGSVAGIREEKTSLFDGIGDDGVIVINNDDENLQGFALIEKTALRQKRRKITFGRDAASDVMAKDIRQEKGGTSFSIVIADADCRCHLPVLGLHNIHNALGAAAIAFHLGFSPQQIATALSAYRPPQRRMNVIPLSNGAFVIDDTYNANPESMKRALETLAGVVTRHSSAIVVLGDMLELGEEARKFHQEIGFYAGTLGMKRLFLRGRHTSEYAAGAILAGVKSEMITIFTDVAPVANTIYESLQAGDGVLVKGSRSMKMEEVVEAIKKIDGKINGRGRGQ